MLKTFYIFIYAWYIGKPIDHLNKDSEYILDFQLTPIKKIDKPIKR